MGRLFGTDGVRGVANRDLSADLALRLGRAAVLLREQGAAPALVARDTRPSGDLLAAALMAGLMSAGADVIDGGVLPTPALAWLTRHTGASLGAMISASHNPVPDNGIKLFRGDGFKLADEVEDEIERSLGREAALPVGVGVGRRQPLAKKAQRVYVDHLIGLAQPRFHGKVVIDAAYGAATAVVEDVFAPICETLVVLHGQPDGTRINVDCGSTHPQAVQACVRREGADIGLAFDGDADRLIAVDERGQIVDGDAIIAILATMLQRQQAIGQGVALTVMSNLGLRRYLQSLGLEVAVTQVGDRYVLEQLRARGLLLGGEQSGHVIYLPQNTTGDGLQTAVYLLSAMAASKVPLSELSRCFERFPQRLESVPVSDTARLMADGRLQGAVRQVQARLGERGRVLIRPSGTEPLIRVMVEADDEGLCDHALDDLTAVVRDVVKEVSAL